MRTRLRRLRICFATPATGRHAGYWLCGRKPNHSGLHIDMDERGVWNP